MTLDTAIPAGLKTRQRQMWGSGDYASIAHGIVGVSERLVDAADVQAGSAVLDVACGTGNATLAAARCNADVLGVDFVPSLLDRARLRAAAEGLTIRTIEGDAEQLPVDDAAFDVVLSVFGCMFAPDHRQVAAELVRACKPGGTIALAAWRPDGFIGELLRTVSRYVAPPPGVQSPVLWGTHEHIVDLFDGADVRSTTEVNVFRFASPEDFVQRFSERYGPTLAAFSALDEAGREALAADMAALARRHDRNRDGGPVAIPSTYLQTTIRRR